MEQGTTMGAESSSRRVADSQMRSLFALWT